MEVTTLGSKCQDVQWSLDRDVILPKWDCGCRVDARITKDIENFVSVGSSRQILKIGGCTKAGTLTLFAVLRFDFVFLTG